MCVQKEQQQGSTVGLALAEDLMEANKKALPAREDWSSLGKAAGGGNAKGYK